MHLFAKYVYLACCMLLGLLLLASCGGQTAGVEMYDIVYESGYSHDPYNRDAQFPIDGTALHLAVTSADALAVQLLDAQGAILANYKENLPALQRRELLTVRGEAAARGVIMANCGILLPYDEETGEGALWLCMETWRKTRYNGFVDGALTGGELMLVDAQSGQTLFSAATNPGELFLAASGNRCYFYTPGKAARRKDEQTLAQIYWRDINYWLLPHVVCSFDYVGAPKSDGQPIERLRFYPQTDCLRLDFTCYEQTNAENDRWDYVVKHSVEVPLKNQPESETEETT